MQLHMSAFGGKADAIALHVSAFDPKRTLIPKMLVESKTTELLHQSRPDAAVVAMLTKVSHDC